MQREKNASRYRKPKAGEPVWELARLFPNQGRWAVEDYLALDIGRAVEYSDGFIEVLPMPTFGHQRIVKFLFLLLASYLQVNGVGGEVLFAPLPVKLGRRQYREPDILYLSAERLEQSTGDYPLGGDLVMEVVSGSHSDRERDLVEKRYDYAQAGIPEYWIVDPEEKVIVVLRLEGDEFAEHGRFGAGQVATSHLLSGFAVAVDEVWAAAQ